MIRSQQNLGVSQSDRAGVVGEGGRCSVHGMHTRRKVSMDVRPYLDFNGECEAAFTFYEQCLGGTLGAIFRYRGTPLADQVPADWQDKVMHASLTLGRHILMGADVAPDRY